ncbi:MAG: hypothetical protein ACYCOR_17930 [Acidobacteriaceae bacterium]
MNTKEQFFYEQAGYSYDPKKETQEQGHERCAKALAAAQAWAFDNDVEYRWMPDDEAGEWVCIATIGDKQASLGAIDFADGADPWGQPYKRVIEAELALELMA